MAPAINVQIPVTTQTGIRATADSDARVALQSDRGAEVRDEAFGELDGIASGKM